MPAGTLFPGDVETQGFQMIPESAVGGDEVVLRTAGQVKAGLGFAGGSQLLCQRVIVLKMCIRDRYKAVTSKMKTGAAGDQKRVARRACLTLLDENAILFSDAFHSLCSAGERKMCIRDSP